MDIHYYEYLTKTPSDNAGQILDSVDMRHTTPTQVDAQQCVILRHNPMCITNTSANGRR
jgi:hypothetical protein